ncbi:hypothetical protein [Clostridium cellulovorans]|uniref:Uncharacterized protein n=1 Tax=Clostridium cellulovorans (strain ATCC 35296 / DSM 3052 / OCM 3 / 743B) TaxID=573061 RepID=D9SWY2_CLOC7|nr:hypothetical protein [Clostridium cellulovorans]ADL51343.1 hypothetical protein Clocel_1596 [Clostridium cellulovorans 743B]
MFWQILNTILLVVLVLMTHNLLKIFLLSKIKVSKWIVLGATIVFLGMSIFAAVSGDVWLLYLGVFLTSNLALWFMDLKGWGGDKTLVQNDKSAKEEKIVIKSKAKPNRVKNLSEQEKEKMLLKKK